MIWSDYNKKCESLTLEIRKITAIKLIAITYKLYAKWTLFYSLLDLGESN